MGKWAMYKRRGSSPPGEAGAAPLPEVPLTGDGTNTLDWSGFVGPDPDHWRVFENGTEFDTVAGSGRTYDITGQPTSNWTVLGRDGADNPVTQMSNAVVAP